MTLKANSSNETMTFILFTGYQFTPMVESEKEELNQQLAKYTSSSWFYEGQSRQSVLQQLQRNEHPYKMLSLIPVHVGVF